MVNYRYEDAVLFLEGGEKASFYFDFKRRQIQAVYDSNRKIWVWDAPYTGMSVRDEKVLNDAFRLLNLDQYADLPPHEFLSKIFST